MCVCESEERYTRLDSQAKLTLDTVFNLRWTEKRSNPGKEEGGMMGCYCRCGRGKVFIKKKKKRIACSKTLRCSSSQQVFTECLLRVRHWGYSGE